MNPRGLVIGGAAAAGALLVYRDQLNGSAVSDALDQVSSVVSPIVDSVSSAVMPVVEDLLNMGPNAQALAALLGESNVAAFLMTIRTGEGTAGPMGYNTLVGGSLFYDLSDHPRQLVTLQTKTGTIKSTAAGAYQFLSRTWDECKRGLALPDFSAPSQDVAALYLIRRRGALDDVRAGRFVDAVRKCRGEWASLPGAGYGQPEVPLARAMETFVNAGGVVA